MRITCFKCGYTGIAKLTDALEFVCSECSSPDIRAVPDGRGGVRVPGPGKKLGRPLGKAKKKINVSLPVRMVDELQATSKPSATVEEAVRDYFKKM